MLVPWYWWIFYLPEFTLCFSMGIGCIYERQLIYILLKLFCSSAQLHNRRPCKLTTVGLDLMAEWVECPSPLLGDCGIQTLVASNHWLEQLYLSLPSRVFNIIRMEPFPKCASRNYKATQIPIHTQLWLPVVDGMCMEASCVGNHVTLVARWTTAPPHLAPWHVTQQPGHVVAGFGWWRHHVCTPCVPCVVMSRVLMSLRVCTVHIVCSNVTMCEQHTHRVLWRHRVCTLWGNVTTCVHCECESCVVTSPCVYTM